MNSDRIEYHMFRYTMIIASIVLIYMGVKRIIEAELWLASIGLVPSWDLALFFCIFLWGSLVALFVLLYLETNQGRL